MPSSKATMSQAADNLGAITLKISVNECDDVLLLSYHTNFFRFWAVGLWNKKTPEDVNLDSEKM